MGDAVEHASVMNDCGDSCLNNMACGAFSWVTREDADPCWLHQAPIVHEDFMPYDPSIVTIYLLDRTCLG